jgi:hypothetical protein
MRLCRLAACRQAATAALLSCAALSSSPAAYATPGLQVFSIEETRAGNLCMGQLQLLGTGEAVYRSPCTSSANGTWREDTGGNLEWTLEYDKSTLSYVARFATARAEVAKGNVLAVPRSKPETEPRRVGTFVLRRLRGGALSVNERLGYS